MRLGRRPLALVAMIGLAACGASTDVHSSRADPIDGSTVSSSDPTDTTEPTTDTTGADNGTLDWGTCDDPSAEDPSLECATMEVPLDYDAPSGDKIDLALIRVPASEGGSDAVLYNPGGPGGSGFEYIAVGGTSIAFGLNLVSQNLVGFDPRGVDRSGGLRCVSDEFQDQHLYVDDTPDTPEEQVLKDESENGFADACKEKYGDTLRFYSTENTARDMDAIRNALGLEQISFIGISYGTYLGAVYASMFPDGVRAMVLDSAFEPNGDTAQQEFETQLVGFEGAFNNWAEWCQDNPVCDFRADDVGARWDALEQKLDDAPITSSDGRIANNATVERATVAALYSESQWPVLGQALASAEGGDPTGILAIADDYNGRQPDGTFNTLFQSFPIIQCASGIAATPPEDAEALAATLRAEAPRFGKDITGEDVLAESDQCNKLVGHPEQVEISYAGDGPIVVVGGTNDPATPIRWAQKMVVELGPNARLVTYTGEGHGQLLVSSCVTDIEAAVLTELALPESNTVCEPNPAVAKPDWWDALPVPDGMSDIVTLPALAAVLGADPTQVFSEMRTTSLSANDAVDAYTAALGEAGFRQFDAPSSLPVDDTAQGAYSDYANKTMVVIALGPRAFNDKELQVAKTEVPPGTTVVWLVAVDI
ncbi:MAG: alpha/beta fold hydrolase [Ilumatobacteraceae bacterium]